MTVPAPILAGLETWGWAGLGTLLGGVLGVAGKFVLDLLKVRQGMRRDTVQEWHKITEHLQRQVEGHSTRLFALSEAHARCEREAAEQRGEIRLMQATIIRLQAATGDQLPEMPNAMPCLIIAGADGVIREASPAIAPVLHWLPRDVRGKSIEVLIPERLRQAHRDGLERFRDTNQPPWPDRSIVTHALSKEGDEIPVTITLSSFPAGPTDWLLSATVRRRQASEQAGVSYQYEAGITRNQADQDGESPAETKPPAK